MEAGVFVTHLNIDGVLDNVRQKKHMVVIDYTGRKCRRAIFDDKDLSLQLWKDLKNKLPNRKWVDEFGDEWVPTGLNSKWRFISYEMGDYFNWHNDGLTCLSPQEQTLASVTVYLNTLHQADGGMLEFKNHMHDSICPVAGQCVVLDICGSHPSHQSQPLLSEKTGKFILRSDIVGRRASPTQHWHHTLFHLREAVGFHPPIGRSMVGCRHEPCCQSSPIASSIDPHCPTLLRRPGQISLPPETVDP